MSGRGAENGLSAALAAHINRFGSGGSTVVNRGIGNIHAGQLADHGLIFKDRLKDTLADFCLIRGVAGEEFLFADDALDDSRDVVVISAGAAEDGIKHNAVGSDAVHLAADLQLGFAGGQVQLVVEPELSGDVLKQLVNRGQPHAGEHFLPLLKGGRNIGAHVMPPRSKVLRKQRNQAVLLYRKLR